MRRRAVLTIAGTMLTAGCGALTGNNGGGGNGGGKGLHSDDMGVDPNLSEDEINNPDLDSEIESIDTNISELDTGIDDIDIDEIDVGSDISGENETATPANQKAERRIARAHKSIATAYSKYVEQASSGGAITDVDPTLDSFSSLRLKRHIDHALDELKTASNSATEGQKANILALQQVGLFIYKSAQVDEHLVKAHNDFNYASKNLLNDNLSGARQGRFDMNENVKKAEDSFSVTTDIGDVSFNASPLLDSGSYESKIRQLDTQLAAFDSFSEGIESSIAGVESARKGVQFYRDRNWSEAEQDLQDANSNFVSADLSFSMSDNYSQRMLREYDVDMEVSIMEVATDHLTTAADALANYKTGGIAGTAQRNAQEIIKESTYVKDMDTFVPILNL